MTEPRTLLALGTFTFAERSRVAQVAEESAFDVHFEEDPQAAGHFMDLQEIQALLLDGDLPQSEGFAVERRAELRHATLPLLSLTEEISDLGFISAFSWGADDLVIRQDSTPLRQRLRLLPKKAPSPPEAVRGTAIVADSDRARRILIGRVLRNAGYAVTFAVEQHDLLEFSKTSAVSVIVASSTVIDSPRPLVESLRASGSVAPFVLSCPPRELKQRKALLEGLSFATVTDGFAPAENVLFVSNELGRKGGADLRASERMLYGTKVAFRGAGRERDDHGFTYNVSDGGLYVRTLAPPDDELIWLELCPPRSERRVRLVGKVAWRRGLMKGEYATVPPGFGIEIVDGAKADVAAWREGCRVLEQLGEP